MSRFYCRCDNISFKSRVGILLKKIINLWLKLCKKFNFKIFLKTKNSEKYIRSNHILKMNGYDKYIISPIIIMPFTQNEWINTEYAFQVISSYM